MAWRARFGKYIATCKFVCLEEKSAPVKSYFAKHYTLMKLLNPSTGMLFRDYPRAGMDFFDDLHAAQTEVNGEEYEQFAQKHISDAYVVFEFARPNDDFWPDADASRLPKTGQKMVAFTGQRLMVDLDGLDADQIDAVLERVTEAAERNGARSAAPLLAAV